MKKVILKSFALLMLTMALAALAVQAQSARLMKANIPFSFTIGNQTLPAGEYTVRPVNQDSGKTALLFKSADGRTNRIVNMMTAERSATQEETVIVFTKYGESYFLSQVWTDGDRYGLALPKSSAERQLSKGDIAQNRPARVTVALVSGR
jgi:hypothetical protein